jgi:transcriptional regulator with XRE-family HTH domain
MTKQRDFNDLPTWIPAQMRRVGIESVEQLAYRAGGLSRMAIYRWLHDQSRPTPQTMAKVCRALGVELAEGLRQFSPKRNGRPPERDDYAERKDKRKAKK